MKNRVIFYKIPTFTDKKLAEVDTFLWDFRFWLNGGETITNAVITPSVVTGVDAHPENLLSGSRVINGTKVEQLITGGTIGVKYKLSCAITTSAARTVISDSLLTVVA